MKEPKVQVGILSASQIEFILPSTYHMNGEKAGGRQTVTTDKNQILWNNCRYDELLFEPINEVTNEATNEPINEPIDEPINEATNEPINEPTNEPIDKPTNEATDAFELIDVTIGINFHWERKENQRFLGALKIIIADGKLTAINVIGVEDYLTSVISSEMSATASLELLKAHAVISRSWLLAQIEKNKEIAATQTPYSAFTQTDEELIRWYDREDHTLFDVCADDHCQRYQGITRASTQIVKQAIDATRGQVLMFEGKICDARFSKCCGGATEEFQYCWEEVKHPYLTKQRDSQTTIALLDLRTEPDLRTETNLHLEPGIRTEPDLRIEAEAERWIRTSPEAFCNTKQEKVLAQVLNNYDRETADFYRWKVAYTQETLSELIKSRSGIDYGQICELIPIERGVSGRLVKLKIVGTKRTRTIGKELEIRRTLSPSHLYSSAFVVDRADVKAGIPGRFLLTGAGWGHGVGLCQIGAAVMGEEGTRYDAILLHYYRGATIETRYPTHCTPPFTPTHCTPPFAPTHCTPPFAPTHRTMNPDASL